MTATTPRMRGEAEQSRRFHTGGSSVFRIQTLLPPSKLGGELEQNAFAGSYQLLPPSGQARTEGVNWNSVYFIDQNDSQRCACGAKVLTEA